MQPVKKVTSDPSKVTTTTTKIAPVNAKTATSTTKIAGQNAVIHHALFTKENYKWMVIGLVIMALGFFLMAGGKSSNVNIFNDKDVYSPMRITIAPILIVAGLIVEIFAIMKKPK